jgi:hypothetical protein
MSLVKNPNAIRLAMLGSTPGNGHPYSWSAMFNGYHREAMTKECPFAGIPVYLNKQPPKTLTIPGAKVTHICFIGEGGFTAEHVAKCSLVPNVVEKPTDVIVVASADMYGSFGCLQLCGTAGKVQLSSGDTFYSFKTQLEAFIGYLRTGVHPYPFSETVELMQLVIAGIRSRERDGRDVALIEI